MKSFINIALVALLLNDSCQASHITQEPIKSLSDSVPNNKTKAVDFLQRQAYTGNMATIQCATQCCPCVNCCACPCRASPEDKEEAK